MCKILPCKNPPLELPRVTLHLIAMRVHTPKVVCTAVNIQHDALPTRMVPVGALSLVVIVSHFDPFALEVLGGTAPLPPLLAADPLDSMRA